MSAILSGGRESSSTHQQAPGNTDCMEMLESNSKEVEVIVHSTSLDAANNENPQQSNQPRKANKRTWRKFVNEVLIVTIPELRREDYERQTTGIDETDVAFSKWFPDDKKTDRIIYNCFPPPLFIPIATVTQIIVFIVYAIRQNDVTFNQGGVDFKSPLIYDPTLRYQVWRFLTYSMLHNGVFHILTNSLLQLTLGTLLELQHKFWRVAPVYILGILSGSLASSLVDPFVFLVGASGGVYALLGGHIATVILNWKQMQHQWKNSVRSIMLSGLVRVLVIFLFISCDTGLAVYTRFANRHTGSKQRVSFAAHIGSLIAGSLSGVFFLRNLTIRRWEKIVTIISIVAYVLLLIAAITFNFICADKKLCPRTV